MSATTAAFPALACNRMAIAGVMGGAR